MTLVAVSELPALTTEPTPVGPVVSSVPAPVDTARRLAWLVRHGTPWLAKRSLDLVPTLAWLMARQVLHDCIASVGERGPRHR